MISTIVVYDEKYYYKGKEYTNDLKVLLGKINKKIKIILCTENILIKKYNYHINDIEKFIDNKISEDFNNKDNLLFHYEIDKENKIIYLYSIRDNIKKIYSNASELNIQITQFNVRDYVNKKIRGYRNKIIIFNIKNIKHLIKISNNFIIDAIISKDIKEIEKYINDINNENYILVKDKKITEIDNINFDYSIDLGVDKFEKVYKE